MRNAHKQIQTSDVDWPNDGSHYPLIGIINSGALDWLFISACESLLFWLSFQTGSQESAKNIALIYFLTSELVFFNEKSYNFKLVR